MHDHHVRQRRRLLAVALAGEGTLAVLAFAWMRVRDLPAPLGPVAPGLLAGGVTAVAFGAINYWLLRRAPDVAAVRSLRAVYSDLLQPLFAGLRWPDIALVSLAAGVGEEALFRGAVQAETGTVAASVLFGLMHVGSREMIVFGVWAAVIGLALGWLRQASGGLLAPMVAHGLYDALALAYIARSDRIGS